MALFNFFNIVKNIVAGEKLLHNRNYFYQDTQHLQKSPIFSDNTSIEKKIIVNIPFLLNSQIPILFDDFLCYPIFYRHRQIIFDSKSQKHTTHYALFLEKYLHKYEQLNDHFLILLDYFQKEKLDSILNSHYFSLEFQKKTLFQNKYRIIF